MAYLLSFLEGIITFISPCLLPMLPVYVIYFAGGDSEQNTGKAIRNALGFVLGFTVVFVLLGVFAASLGSLLRQHQTAVNLVTGAIVVLLGLHFMGILKVPFLDRTHRLHAEVRPIGFFRTVLFGMVFSIGWTPCVGAFLGSALLLAAQQGSVLQGVGMLLLYSLGLGIPFVVSAALIQKLKSAIAWLGRHSEAISRVCGCLLIVIGVCMMAGWMNALLSLLS